jgi:hypothetical protein
MKIKYNPELITDLLLKIKNRDKALIISHFGDFMRESPILGDLLDIIFRSGLGKEFKLPISQEEQENLSSDSLRVLNNIHATLTKTAQDSLYWGVFVGVIISMMQEKSESVNQEDILKSLRSKLEEKISNSEYLHPSEILEIIDKV